MKALLTMILGLVPVLTWGALCNDTYYLQSVSETILSGSSPTEMNTRKVKTVSADLSNLTIMHNAMTYAIMVGFDGACTKTVKPLRLKVKNSEKIGFTDSIENGYEVELYDSNTRVENFKYEYWFGFYKPATSLKSFIGMEKETDSVFSNFYAAVLVVDSVYNQGTLKWSLAGSKFYSLSGLTDSVSLDKGMLDATGVRTTVVPANHKYYFAIQYLKVFYKNQKPTSINQYKRISNNFQSNQIGNVVLLQTGLNSSRISEPLSIYDIMGNKITTVHPTGYAYQWNGRSVTGSEAPGGVYFVQAGNRTLGKFFYSR